MNSTNYFFWGLANRVAPSEPSYWPWAEWVEQQGVGE